MRQQLFALLLGLAAAAAPAAAAAQDDVSWMRYPALSPDGRTIVFTYRGDLYRVPAAGGTAVQLTTHAAHDFMPVWSSDGRHIAFASARHGNFDIFVMPAEGGVARRLTYHSAHEYPYSFSHDNVHVIFGANRLDDAQNRLHPHGSQTELYQVPAGGGRTLQLLTTPAEDVTVSRDGRHLLYMDRKGGGNPWRKYQTSAIARDIWLWDRQTNTHRQVTDQPVEQRSPVFTADGTGFYYLSEESGSFNVHRRPLNGGASVQLTSFRAFPVRFLSAAQDGTLAFGHDGQIYTLAPGGEPRRVAIRIVGDAQANSERLIQVTGNASQLAVSPNGKEVAFIFRGDVFVTSVEGVTTRQITRTPANEAGVGFSPDGNALIYASERDGRWGIYEARRTRPDELYFYASTLISETPVIVNDRQNFQPLYSPDGSEIAWIEDFTNLRVYNRASRQSRTLLTDREIFATGPTHHFEWSPDGRWMLFNFNKPGMAPSDVGIVATDGRSPAINLTRSGFTDGGATWIMDGAAMLFRSNRDGLRTLAMTGGSQADAYAMFFTQQAWDRFNLTKEELALVRAAEERANRNGARSDADTVPAPLTLDLAGAPDRRARLTIHSSSLGDALVSKDGETLYYLARFERGLNLWSTNLRTRETRQVLALNANSGRMVWDSERKYIFLLADGAISKIDPAAARRETVTIRGEMFVDDAAERAVAFDNVWRRTRDTFYTRSFHGVDWEALRPMYEKYLPHIGNNHEFAELLSELLGELNVSHSGATYSPSDPAADATAALGIFYDQSVARPGIAITEVLRGGPLDRAGLDIRAGMVIEAIDGEEVGADRDLAEFLNRKADRNVLLRIRDGDSTREVVVRPITLAAENRLRYERWVRMNAEEVDRLSNGRLGYVHVPGMNDNAYRTVFEEVLGKYHDRDGLVVDTRFNGGGDLVADLVMFLSGVRFFDYTTDTRSRGFEPNFRWTRPSVTLANEANYSDGHCFAWAYQELKIGPLIGMPVPGTCTFGGWATILDGVRWGVPGMGVKDPATGRFLENWQTEPDIRVANEPGTVSRGRDQQLETAVQELQRLVEAQRREGRAGGH
jgi:Tol biopolymer transport system component/C-terminal processing protease CtpA/Prc